MTTTLGPTTRTARVKQAAHRKDTNHVDGAAMERREITSAVTRILWRATAVPAGAWLSIAYPVIAMSLWLGGGYAIAGDRVSVDRTWDHVLPFGKTGVQAHGWIMVGLALALLWCAASYEQHHTVRLWVLRAFRTYCLVIAALWVASWVSYGFTWGPPAWWTLLASLTTWLSRFTPTAPSAAKSRHGSDGHR